MQTNLTAIFAKDEAQQLMQEYIAKMDQYEELLNKIAVHDKDKPALLSHECPQYFKLFLLQVQEVALPELMYKFANNKDDSYVKSLMQERDKILMQMRDMLMRLNSNIYTKQQQLIAIIACKIQSMVQDAAARKEVSNSYQGLAKFVVDSWYNKIKSIANSLLEEKDMDCDKILAKYYLVSFGIDSMKTLVDNVGGGLYSKVESSESKLFSAKESNILETIVSDYEHKGNHLKAKIK